MAKYEVLFENSQEFLEIDLPNRLDLKKIITLKSARPTEEGQLEILYDNLGNEIGFVDIKKVFYIRKKTAYESQKSSKEVDKNGK